MMPERCLAFVGFLGKGDHNVIHGGRYPTRLVLNGLMQGSSVVGASTPYVCTASAIKSNMTRSGC